MKYDAEIVLDGEVVLEYRQDGWIFRDSVQTGNHPFSEGRYILTSRVLKDETIGDERYLTTLSGTVYKVVGTGREAAIDRLHTALDEPKIEFPRVALP